MGGDGMAYGATRVAEVVYNNNMLWEKLIRRPGKSGGSKAPLCRLAHTMRYRCWDIFVKLREERSKVKALYRRIMPTKLK